MPDDRPASTVTEDRFEQVLAGLLLAEENGERLDLSQVFRACPELEAPLREFFRARAGFDRLAPLLAPTAERSSAVTTPPELPPESRFDGYEVIKEVGRGGRGVVYRVSDPELNRPLAVKVLRPELRDESDAVQRFLEEAQLTSQLQHPGVVPVHAIGRLADGRPYFAMKLVRGRTLAQLLAERPAPSHDLPRFLGIFQQVGQAVAYAHSRGVIHRDLKPQNVMVGAFAEVQVMDWGLAKVLSAEVASREAPPGAAAGIADTIRTVRTEAAGHSSADGLVVGTVAYMSPEQAKGQVEWIDERADVFGLGAVLCEVLTGQPPYTGAPAWKLLLARAGELADAFARLDRCDADAELIALARDCLAPERERRPRDAGAVTERVAAYLAGVQERLRRAELERAAAEARRAEAEAKARAERRARRLAVGLIVAMFLIVAGAGGLWLWWDRRQTEERRAITADLDQVLESQQKGQWDDARAALERAEGRLGSGGAPDLRQRIRQGWADLEMVVWIEEAGVPQIQFGVGVRPPRIGMSSGDAVPSLQGRPKEGLFTPEQADADYAEAFRKYGLDLQALDPATAAERIAAASIKEQLLAALDNWAATRWTRDVPGRDHLLAIARQVDSDEWRNRFRDLAVQGNRQRLEELAGQAEVAEQSPATLHMLALALFRVKAYATAMGLLKSAQRKHPGDFWINHDVGFCSLTQRDRSREAATYLQAALALRPQSQRVRRNLGLALSAQGRWVDAENVFRDALKLEPGDARTHSSLGVILHREGKLEEAVAAFWRAIELRPDSVEAHGNLAMTLEKQGKLDEALAVHQKALALDPKNARLHCNYGASLETLGRYPEARAAFEEAVRLQPNLAQAHLNLGGLLCDHLHNPDGAIASFRRCLEFDPGSADAHYGLGNAWTDKRLPEKAITAYQQAIRLKPNHAWAHCNLGITLAAKGLLAEAIFEYRTALHIQPEYPEALNALGNAIQKQGNVKGAIPLHRQAVHLQPQNGVLHFNLARVLQADGALNEAVAEYRTTTRLRPDFAGGWINLAGALRQNRGLDESIEAWKEVIRRFPRRPEGYTGLGNALAAKGLMDEAIAAYRDAVREKPNDPLAHLNLGLALEREGRLAESVESLEAAALCQPGRPAAYFNLGNVLLQQGRWDDAAAAYRKAIAARKDYAEAHCNLGAVLQRSGQLADSLAAFRRGHELGSRDPHWRYPSAQWVREAERLIALERQLPEIVAGKLQPANGDERHLFARLCYCKRHYEAAARLHEAALAAAPKQADAPGDDTLYSAVCSAASAGSGLGEDAAKLDDDQRASRRRQALDWLRTGLGSWTKFLDRGKHQARATVERMLQHWQADPDLAGVRDKAGLAKLPDTERVAWEKLWADVEALRKRARETK
jgi:serine/threonine-protein kinase